jgi:hypothetical protein
MKAPLCTYCKNPAFLVSGEIIYPHRHDLFSLKFWNCPPCKAYVGCHKNTKDHKPFGILANAELRKLKSMAHAAFDPKWKSGRMRRSEAYGILADRLGIKKKDCHIGEFDESMCRRVIEISNEDWSI